MSRLLHVSKSKYRVVISDTLPYERPMFFSNRFFARFLKFYGVEINGDVLIASKHTEEPGLKEFLEILGGKKGASLRFLISSDASTHPVRANTISTECRSGRCRSRSVPYCATVRLDSYSKTTTFCRRLQALKTLSCR